MSVKDAVVFGDALDPGGYKDWEVNINEELETGENIDLSQTLITLGADAVTLGLEIDGAGDTHPPGLDVDTGRLLTFWASVAEASRGNPEFDCDGVVLQVTINFVTTPQARKYERTVGIRVKQR